MPDLTKQLLLLGFKPPQARKAVTYLSEPSPFASNLLRSASPLDACIEYLILHLPEVDLPERFLPSNNSSNPFITGVHGQTDDISRRWVEDRAVKFAGWPVHIVRECIAEEHLSGDWALLIAALDNRLMGKGRHDVTIEPSNDDIFEEEDVISEEDIEMMGAVWKEESTLTMSLFSAPLQINFVIPPNYKYNRSTRPPPMYITSTSAPAYIRLHLLSHLLEAFASGVILENGWGILLGAMQVVEEQWGMVESQGAPDIAHVMRHLMPSELPLAVDEEGVQAIRMKRTDRSRVSRKKEDLRTDAVVKEEFETLQKTDNFRSMLKVRERLPAFSAKGEFLDMLDRSRVIVVVGETGKRCVPIYFHPSIY